jgi:hypothetical protein
VTAVFVSRPTTPLATSDVLLEGSRIGLDLTGFSVLDVLRAFAICVLLVGIDRTDKQEASVSDPLKPVKAPTSVLFVGLCPV